MEAMCNVGEGGRPTKRCHPCSFLPWPEYRLRDGSWLLLAIGLPHNTNLVLYSQCINWQTWRNWFYVIVLPFQEEN
jgi:hypothetical protein